MKGHERTRWGRSSGVAVFSQSDGLAGRRGLGVAHRPADRRHADVPSGVAWVLLIVLAYVLSTSVLF